ncbi:hypothetical protein Tco_1356101 [Tanacetum coccineum]
MSKLDRFLISEGLMELSPNISAVCLDRYLSDHRPILLRELSVDYGPDPFRLYHYWFTLEGFDKMVEETWNEGIPDEANAMIKMNKKLKFLNIELSQKEKVKWAIEGGENSRYFHGIINKKRAQIAIRGVLADGVWIDGPIELEEVEFPNRITVDQRMENERDITHDEIKKAV